MHLIIKIQPKETAKESLERALINLGCQPDLHIPLQALLQEMAKKAAQPW